MEEKDNERRRFPAGRIAFAVSLLAALVCVGWGYSEMNRGGCDGGTCLIGLILGLACGGAAMLVGFPVLWMILALLAKLGSRRDPGPPA